MNYSSSIKHIYPHLIPGRDFFLADQGNGVYISEWKVEEPLPTDKELQAAWDAIKDLPPELTPPTDAERVDALEAENKLLKAQNQALSNRADFIEDIIAEMAMKIY